MSRFLLLSALVMVLLALAVSVPAAEAGSASLSVSPASQDVDAGAAFAVAIMQDADVTTSGAQADFGFDEALVRVVSVEKGAAYAAGSLIVGVAPQTVEQAITEANTTGTLQNVSAFFAPGAGSVPAGSATFVTVNMEALDGVSGTSQLTLSEAEMLDANGESVAVTLSGGEVSVGEGGGGGLTWGDVNCLQGVNAVDALSIQRANVNLPYNASKGCPEIGSEVSGRMWGDVNCGGVVNAVDSLALQRWKVNLPFASEDGCPEVGSAYP